jgi:hypothetical protein
MLNHLGDAEELTCRVYKWMDGSLNKASSSAYRYNECDVPKVAVKWLVQTLRL